MIQPRTTALYHGATRRYAAASSDQQRGARLPQCAMCGNELPDLVGGRQYCPPCAKRRRQAKDTWRKKAYGTPEGNDFAGAGIATCHVCGRPVVEHKVSERCYE